MDSVRELLRCLGIETSGNVSVLGTVFGFIRQRVPADPDPTVTTQVSLRDQMQRCASQHLHLNVIRVGFDAIPGGATAQDAALEQLDWAVHRTRDIYRQADVGVGRVQHWFINSTEANGLDDLGSEGESDDLIRRWSVPNEGIDAFVVRNISATFVGKAAAIPGSCNKKNPDDGVVAGMMGRPSDAFARTFAHEVGHHLGLEHNHGVAPACPPTTGECNNLMAQTRCADQCGGGVTVATLLDGVQGTTMRSHCSVQPGC